MLRYHALIRLTIALLIVPSLIWSKDEIQNEVLAIRRIGISYLKQEPFLIKKQIESFFSEFPNSEYTEHLSLLLANTYFHDANFTKAKDLYCKIVDPSLKTIIQMNFWYTLYFLRDYSTLHSILQQMHPQSMDPQKQQAYTLFLASCAIHDIGILSLNEAEKMLQELCDTNLKPFAIIELKYLYQRQGRDIQLDQDASQLMQLAQLSSGSDSASILSWMTLLYEMTNYAEVIEQGEKLLINQQKVPPEIVYLIGCSHYALNHFTQAVTALSEALEYMIQAPEEKQIACLSMLAACYFKLDDLEKLCSIRNTLLVLEKDNPLLADIDHMKASLLQNKGRYAEARGILYHLVDTTLNEDKRSLFLLDIANTYLEEGNFTKSHDLLSSFAQRNPFHPYASQATRCALAATEKQMLESTTLATSQQLIDDIKLALQTPSTLNANEKMDYLYTLAYTYFDIEEPENAIAALNNLLQTAFDPEKMQAAHLLMACSYQKMGNTESFVDNIEEALACHADRSTVKNSLYSAYQSCLKNGEKTRAIGFLQEAYKAQIPLQTTDLLFLANYYADKYANSPQLEMAAKMQSKELFKKTLNPIAKEKLHLYPEDYATWISLSSPYKASKLFTKIKSIISLSDMLKNPHFSPIIFAYAKNLQIHGDTQLAMQILRDLVDDSNAAYRHIFVQAKLLLAILLKQEWLERNDPKAREEALVLVEDIKTQKSVENTMPYLEACLEWIDLHILETKEEDIEKSLDFYRLAQKEIHADDTIMEKSYTELRKQDPYAEKLTGYYYLYLQACILDLEAKRALDAGNEATATTKHVLAEEILYNLTEH